MSEPERALQGWCSDPWGLHEARYFSAGRPTKLVRDGRTEAYEDPPATPPSGQAVRLEEPERDPDDLRRPDDGGDENRTDYSTAAELTVTRVMGPGM